MITFLTILLAVGGATTPSAIERGLRLCRPELERSISGNIVAINATSTSGDAKRLVIKGTMRVSVGMGDPGPGNASAHHLIQSDLQFTCWLRGLKVRKVIVINTI